MKKKTNAQVRLGIISRSAFQKAFRTQTRHGCLHVWGVEQNRCYKEESRLRLTGIAARMKQSYAGCDVLLLTASRLTDPSCRVEAATPRGRLFKEAAARVFLVRDVARAAVASLARLLTPANKVFA